MKKEDIYKLRSEPNIKYIPDIGIIKVFWYEPKKYKSKLTVSVLKYKVMKIIHPLPSRRK